MSILKFTPLGSYSLTLLNLPIQFDYLLRSSDKNISSLWTDYDVSLTIPCGRKKVFILDFFRGFNLDFDKKLKKGVFIFSCCERSAMIRLHSERMCFTQ